MTDDPTLTDEQVEAATRVSTPNDEDRATAAVYAEMSWPTKGADRLMEQRHDQQLDEARRYARAALTAPRSAGGELREYDDTDEELAMARAEARELREENARLRELVALYAEYVEFMDGENQGPVVLAWQHGWRCPEDVYERGVEFRARIAALATAPPSGGDGRDATDTRLPVDQVDRLAQERPPYPPPSTNPRERCTGATGWHRPQPEDWNAGNRSSFCTWCSVAIDRRFTDGVWRVAPSSTGGGE